MWPNLSSRPWATQSKAGKFQDYGKYEISNKGFFWCAPFGYLLFLLFFYNEPELGAGINPGIDLTPFNALHLVYWMRQD